MHAVGFSTGWVRDCVRVRALDMYVCGDGLVFDCLHSKNWTVGRAQNEANRCVLTCFELPTIYFSTAKGKVAECRDCILRNPFQERETAQQRYTVPIRKVQR